MEGMPRTESRKPYHTAQALAMGPREDLNFPQTIPIMSRGFRTPRNGQKASIDILSHHLENTHTCRHSPTVVG